MSFQARYGFKAEEQASVNSTTTVFLLHPPLNRCHTVASLYVYLVISHKNVVTSEFSTILFYGKRNLQRISKVKLFSKRHI